ncbi:malate DEHYDROGENASE, NAD-dependent [Yamadazyma tenuis]|uniref:Malate dehydrogenase n=1 Tax=Candida tenuis (strain ATCC 10573 / BCRC 21748 / CBS 615 / JCM 9827 / NBRC 10315 / NRRL Y-1498 / VKM Y-70) TaxID=590646 RepID=G3B7S5_CANTC|nr:malate dehydrogenase [Yamadazyma tenuis ATCC 10573]XP_006689020.1 uncharacterized protein CANTEDRAFT_115774 [Yamadazyma tenuis ATCC 10573]EGV62849.1 malate dehydrogenase [Yamadazyma tenuis ATCC 10573]EGV62850.1 hypothetical protein CANTEDRAFT_115774 [Yamadazyma tenuis ATCC 10573]WEJ93568.1 malate DEHYDROGENASE, NAD-dependent [Yamadazyma tenuis]
MKVTVCGAAGGIGQPLSLLLKLNPHVDELALFDIVNVHGVAADLNHINTPAKVTGHQPKDKADQSAVRAALERSDLVVIPAGVPRKPGMTRADLFNINASIIRDLVKNIGLTCPDASILIISNPVNSTVPIAAEVLKKLGVFNPSKLFGVTTLDSVRAETFLGDLVGEPAPEVKGRISVIGGHSGDTIIPLVNITTSISQKVQKISTSDYDNFINRVQFGGDEVVKAKNGAGSATLSMAYAGYRFAENILQSYFSSTFNSYYINDSAYIYLPGFEKGEKLSKKYLDGIDYFAVPVALRNGAVESLVNPFEEFTISDAEKQLISKALPGLKKSIEQGAAFVTGTKL